MANIHPTAIIEPGAQLGDVEIEPYAIIKKNVVLHDQVIIKSHAYIDGHTTIGEGTTIWPSASIGTQTQDLKFKGEKTFVRIGKHCNIREFATINSSTQENSSVEIGDYCHIMAYCHIAHDSKVGHHVVMSNCATLAGHVTVGDHAVIGGFAPVHQYTRVGEYAMIGGMSRILHDIPPFTIGCGIPFKIGGINIVGLKRSGISLDIRSVLTKVFKIFYRQDLKLSEALKKAEKECLQTAEVEKWMEFCRNPSSRGIMGFQALT